MLCLGIVLLLLCTFCGCGGSNYAFPYDAEYQVSSFQIVNTVNASQAVPFAADLCIVEGDLTDDEKVDMSRAEAALLCDINREEVLYAKNAYERLHPASLTKVMTAIVAIKYGSMDQMLTATNSVIITETGATLCGLKPGDSMTLSQALTILLMYSANDAAMLIAEGVGGDVDSFIDLMNEEAIAIGATNTHFANPHGLTQEDHYTTAYDLYLIFNEAIKYETFREIIQMTTYSTTYTDANGRSKELSFHTSNQYLNGNKKQPENITVLGGKTGTTNAAGSCLVLLTKDTSGNLYISVILRATSRDELYMQMTDLLNEIGN